MMRAMTLLSQPTFGRRSGPVLLALLLLALTCGCRQEQPPPPPAQATATSPLLIGPASHGELDHLLREHRYDWPTLRNGVPGLILTRLPTDLNTIEEPAERKRLFFLSVLPMVLLVNEEISQQREELLDLFARHDRGDALDDRDLQRLAELAAAYRIERDPLSSSWVRDRLLERVDIIPPSMVLAQAATESGYGTSRFARLANNLFGEMTFIRGSGLEPLHNAGAPFEARRFATLYDSVQAYMRNLNTNSVYRRLWRDRARMRAEGNSPQGTELAMALTPYSERGEDYVRDIRTIIKTNRLSLLRDVRLRPGPPPPPPRPVTAIADLVAPTAE